MTVLTTKCGNGQDDQQIGQLVVQPYQKIIPSGARDADGNLPPEAMPSIATQTAVRRLTPRECERLQGFPDDWTATSNGKPQADSARYRQMGNAVAVPCVEWIARRLVERAA